ncbi:MAG: DUF4327 family protein [Pseudanabaenaceae cyanobacterium SKYGB_i_bin29]|nr:DUF4327 family protein [Pseudanabaenaceae cyanobacterium SKYG29]MDW8421765.1 DUF4327 family protein [Pseudanabaenaceae cyanobacterium SKYGB_i_bin29]
MATKTLTIDAIREEVLRLIAKGLVTRNQPIHVLSKFYPDREWLMIEKELEINQYLLRDRISDLVGREEWSWD